MNDRSVLVTGGHGFVGRAVKILLQRKGYGVVLLDRIASERGEREISCDITDTAKLQRVFEMEDVGSIIHLAAILPTAAQREPVLATQVNVSGSLNLLEMARRFDVRRFVFGSSLSVYGTCPENQVVSEDRQAAPEDLYGAAKVYVEQLGTAYRQRYGLEFVSLRIGRVVGPGAQSTTSAWRSEIFELLQADTIAEIAVPYVDSERVLLVHVDDVASMLVTLLSAPRTAHAVYNAPCESVIVGDLKRNVEGLNSSLRVKLGDQEVAGNPRLLDALRFESEFGWRCRPIVERLRTSAGRVTPER